MVSQTMLAGMTFSIIGTPNSHDIQNINVATVLIIMW